jgi:hypothetical protein
MPMPNAPAVAAPHTVPAAAVPYAPTPNDPINPWGLMPGDIVRYVHDEAGSRDCRIVLIDAPTLERYNCLTAPFGSNSQLFQGRVANADMYRLVRRPAPGEMVITRGPPAAYDVGMDAESAVDFEFCKDLADYYRRPGVPWDLIVTGTADNRYYPDQQDGIPLTPAEKLRACVGWLEGVYGTDNGQRFGQRFGAYPRGVYSQHVAVPTDPAELAKWFARYLTRFLNAVERSRTRCPECAAEGLNHTYQIAPCTHFQCAVCAQQFAGTERCAVCEGLRIAAGEWPSDARCCTSCCTHTTCGCGTECDAEPVMKASKCGTCKKTAKHCKCPVCAKCHKASQKACCGRCKADCQCIARCMPFIPGSGGSHGMRPLFKFFAPPDEKGMTRLLGTEIETTGTSRYSPLLSAAVEKWQASIIGDGSVEGAYWKEAAQYGHEAERHRGGVELVTQPAGGSKWLEMIADFGAGFAESKAVTSPSCGLHVHVDGSDIDIFGLIRLVKLYAHLENSIYNALPISRDDTQYSKRCGTKYLNWVKKLPAEPSKGDFALLQYGVETPRVGSRHTNPDDPYSAMTITSATKVETLNKIKLAAVKGRSDHKYDGTRYHGLNIHSYWHRGTFEFRHHHGTNDPQKIVNWGIFVGSIVDTAAHSTNELIDEMLKIPAREVIMDVMDIRGETLEWLQSRWDLFTMPDGKRRIEPERDEVTGEV